MAIAFNEEEAGPATAPMRGADRVPSLDVLRGFALLGILVMNMNDFASATIILHGIPLEVVSMTASHHAADMAVMTVKWLFFDGRMFALFATLFGAGAALLLDRIERRRGEGAAADIFHRRNMWLMLFGLIHGLAIWNGDVLFIYGTLALLVFYPLRHVTGRRLVIAGLAISLLGGTFAWANITDLRAAWPAAQLQQDARTARLEGRPLTIAQAKAVAEAVAKRREALAALPKKTANGRMSYSQGLGANATEFVEYLTLVFTSGIFLEALGMMIAGMGLYKSGFLTGQRSSRTYLAIAVAGYAITIPVVLTGLHHASLFGFSDAMTKVWLLLPLWSQAVICMFANASLVLLLVRKGWLMPAQRGLAAVGRMAFSNYILTSLICQYLFRWGPWKLYGVLEYHQQAYVIAAVWAFNILFSVLWLRLFAFGPLEWAWRSLTYWQRQPMLIPGTRPQSRIRYIPT